MLRLGLILFTFINAEIVVGFFLLEFGWCKKLLFGKYSTRACIINNAYNLYFSMCAIQRVTFQDNVQETSIQQILTSSGSWNDVIRFNNVQV